LWRGAVPPRSCAPPGWSFECSAGEAPAASSGLGWPPNHLSSTASPTDMSCRTSLHHFLGQALTLLVVRSIPDGHQVGLQLRSYLLRYFVQDVAHLVDPAPDPLGLRPHGLDGFDQPRCPIRGHRQRRAQTPPNQTAEVLQPVPFALFAPQAHVQQYLAPVPQNGPGNENRLLQPCLLPHRLVHAVGKQVHHVKTDRSRSLKASYSSHSCSLSRLTLACDSRQTPSPPSSCSASPMSRVDSPRTYISTTNRSSTSVRR